MLSKKRAKSQKDNNQPSKISSESTTKSSSKDLAATLIPPALIKSVMQTTLKIPNCIAETENLAPESNPNQDTRCKLILILKNLLCCEQKSLIEKNVNFLPSDFGLKSDGSDVEFELPEILKNSNMIHSVRDNSIDAFSRLNNQFYRWLFKILFLKDNQLKVEAGLLRKSYQGLGFLKEGIFLFFKLSWTNQFNPSIFQINFYN